LGAGGESNRASFGRDRRSLDSRSDEEKLSKEDDNSLSSSWDAYKKELVIPDMGDSVEDWIFLVERLQVLQAQEDTE
jgi:hypothetical protein